MAPSFSPKPLFVDGARGALFCVYYPAQTSTPTNRILVLPAFAEELNRCRRLVAQTARQLALEGSDVLVVDLYGTGDSAGGFSDARWGDWTADIQRALDWLANESSADKSALLAVRAGALFLPELHESDALRSARVVLWQPVYSGKQLIQQFLRLRVMSNKFAGIDESVNQLVDELRAGRTVEVAGYELHGDLASRLLDLELKALEPSLYRDVTVFEFRATPTEKVTIPSCKFIERLQASNVEARGDTIVAEQFWATQEISSPLHASEVTAARFRA